MLTTYEAIDAEWERLAAGVGNGTPPEGKAVMTAFMQVTAGLPVIARCIHCSQLIGVTEMPGGAAWIAACPCGRSRDTLRGI